MKILFISGHGAGDSGAIGVHNGNMIKESDLTFEAVKQIISRLSIYDVVCDYYPYERNAYYDYLKKDGTLNKYAKFTNYDYVFEVHFNAAVQDKIGDNKVKGAEIWVDKREKVVSVENGILNNLKSLGYTNRGVKATDNLAVLCSGKSAFINNNKNGSTALIEIAFIDDVDDMKLYYSKKNQTWDAIVKGLVDGFGLKKISTKTPTSNTSTKIEEKYNLVVKVPCYKSSSDCINAVNKVKNYEIGEYYVYSTLKSNSNIINITKVKNTAGGWINKKDNVKKIKVGSKVNILNGAIYGGAANGKDVPPYILTKTYTVISIADHKNGNGEEALLQEITSWVPLKFLYIK